MTTVLICITFGAFMMYAFFFGVKVGQKIALGQKIDIKGPIETIKEKKEEYISRQKKIETSKNEEINLHNIEIYDGTSLGQQDFK